MKLKVLVFFIAALALAACDYEFREKPAVNDSSQNSANRAETGAGNQTNDSNAAQTNKTAANSDSAPADSGTGGEPLVLSGTSESATFACGGREVEIVEDATANSYTLTGECKKLTVAGVSNKVSVEKVGEIKVSGISNKVRYVEGIGGKKPKITKTGTSTAVDSVKDLEEKQKAAESDK